MNKICNLRKLFLFIIFLLYPCSLIYPADNNSFYLAPAVPKYDASVQEFLADNSSSSELLTIWIFFTDKKVSTKNDYLNKVEQAVSLYPERALKRRAKVRSPQNILDYKDLNVVSDYIVKVKSVGVRHRATSRWFNGISVEANSIQIQAIEKFPFVREIRQVVGFTRKDLQFKMDAAPQSKKNYNTIESSSLDYGRSHRQLEQIGVPILHQLGYTGKGVLVCMLDTGFYKEHESFQHLKIVAERDFVFDDDDTQTNTDDPEDSSDKHGSLTLSVLAGFKEGRLIGPAYGVDVILAKTEDTRDETPIEEDYWVEGIEWADSLGADVVSSSLGYAKWYTFDAFDGNTALVTQAADRAAGLGIVVVNAAGNYGPTGNIIAPADGDSVLTVGAVDSLGVIANFSSPGPTFDGRIKPDVCAQGRSTYCAVGGVFSKRKPTGYGTASGTSLSTPLVGGVAALLLEIHPEWTPWDVINALKSTASQSSHPDNNYGWGIVDAFRAADLDVPYVKFKSCTVDDDNIGDSIGNGNGINEPGEQVELSVALKNISERTASQNVVASLQTDDPYVSFISSDADFGVINPSDSSLSQQSFLFQIDSSAPDGHSIHFTIDISDDAGNYSSTFDLSLVQHWVISGQVLDVLNQNGVENTILTLVGPLNSSGSLISEQTKTTRTGDIGNYSFLMPEGCYSVQAIADNFILSEAQTVTIPPDTVHLNLSLAAPKMVIDQDSVYISTNEEKSITITNQGSGDLYFSIIETGDRGNETKLDNNINLSSIEKLNWGLLYKSRVYQFINGFI